MRGCAKCGAKTVLYGHEGLCHTHYLAHKVHQAELREVSIANREMLAARVVHPAGKAPKQRARDLWRQRPHEFHGHTAGGTDL